MDKGLRKLYFEALENEIQELLDSATGLLSLEYAKLVDCPLCNSAHKNHQKLFVKRGYTFVRCESCGMIFTNPQVKEDLLGELYGNSRSNDLWVEVQKSEKEKTWKKTYYLNCLETLAAFYPNPTGRLLDIGCSVGYFLELAQCFRNGWDCMGLEISEKAYQFAVGKGLRVERKFLDQLDSSAKFDMFTMFGVLEHLPELHSIFIDIKKHAAPEGCFLMAIVPNAYSLYHMFIQSKSIGFDGRNHLLYFSEQTLRKLFEDNNFEVLSLDTVLTGLDNIKRQIQWLDPYDDNNCDRFIPAKVKPLFENKQLEKLINDYNLGLRLRILARFKP